MARNKGLLGISANFEPQVAAPFDSRIVVENISDLTEIETWQALDGGVYLYKGLVVSVTEDSSLYILKDYQNYDNLDNWQKVYNSGEVLDISGSLSERIDAIVEEQTELIGENGIGVEEDPIHHWTVSVTGDIDILSNVETDSTIDGDILRFDGENWINSDDLSTLEVSAADLNIRVDTLENTIGTLLQGEIICQEGVYIYTIPHPEVDLGSSFPQVSLSVPTSASDLYVQGITNRTQNSFDVVLSDAPTISGYKIYWSMNVGQNALVVKTYNAGFIEVENGDSISLNAAEYDNFEINALGSGEFTMSDPTNMENGQSINVKIQNVDGTMDIDWVGNFKFQNGDAPLLSQSPEAEDIFTILKLSNTFYVSYILNFID